MRPLAVLRHFASPVVLLGVAGCGLQPSPAPHAIASAGISGNVHGGQQPVAGAAVQLYTVGTTGDGSAATPLLKSPVLTDSGGNFTITGDYSCSGATLVYLTATGGNPGSSVVNPNLAEMTALGPCSALSSSTTISVNELSTVAAVSALAPYMTSLSSVGSSAADTAALSSAFQLSAEFVDPSSGVTPGYNVPAGLSVPSTEINTLANILSSCINSGGGTAGSSTACGSLFTLTTPTNGTAPADTISAMINLANNPTLHTAALFNLAPATAPFQPQLTAPPTDFSVKLAANAGIAALTVSPSGLIFPQTAVGFSAQPLTVSVSNNSGTSISILGLGISGSGYSSYAQSNNCPSSLAPGTGCALTVTFTPAVAGSLNALLTLSSSGAGSPQTVALSGTAGAPSAGPITVSTPSQFVYAGALQDITVSNYGTTLLTIRGITSSDPSFVVETNGCGTMLPAQSACTVTVQSNGLFYQNGFPVMYSDTLTIDDDASAGAQKVALASQNYSFVSGSYTLPGGLGTADSSTISFGSWPVASSVSGGKLTVFPGSFYTPINAYFKVAGPSAGDFTLSTQSCITPADSGQSCNIGVTFLPSATGTRTAHFMLDSAEYVRATGVGTPAGPSLIISPQGLSQGQTFINQYGGASVTASYTLVNNGTTTLNLHFTSTGAAAADLTPTGSCAALAPQASCTLSVAFALAAGTAKPGSYPGSIVIADSASTYTQTLPVPVTVSYALLGTNGPLSFPATVPGNTSAPMTLQVFNGNVGSLPLGDPISISAPATANFQVIGPTTCPASSTQVCTFSLVFTPTTLGYLTDQVTLTDTVSGNTTTAALVGTGGAPAITLSARTLTFPARAVGTTSVAMTSTLTNSGTLPLTLNSIVLLGGTNGNFTESNNCGTSLAAGSSCAIGVSFSPSAAGTQSATVQILSNAPSSPDTIMLSGTAQ